MIRVNANSLLAHQKLMDIKANNIANVNTQDFKSADGKISDNLEVNIRLTDTGSNITKELSEQIIIENGFKAQAPAIKTQDEMTKTLLDIKA